MWDPGTLQQGPKATPNQKPDWVIDTAHKPTLALIETTLCIHCKFHNHVFLTLCQCSLKEDLGTPLKEEFIQLISHEEGGRAGLWGTAGQFTEREEVLPSHPGLTRSQIWTGRKSKAEVKHQLIDYLNYFKYNEGQTKIFTKFQREYSLTQKSCKQE